MQLSVLYIILLLIKAIGSSWRVAIVCFLYGSPRVFQFTPFMAGTCHSLPEAHISAIADPFGLSSYFFRNKDLNIQQRTLRFYHFQEYYF